MAIPLRELPAKKGLLAIAFQANRFAACQAGTAFLTCHRDGEMQMVLHVEGGDLLDVCAHPKRIWSNFRSWRSKDGLPYQTLMASVLHRYVSGRLVEPASRRKSA